MSPAEEKLVGLFVGREKDFPEAVMALLNDDYDGVRAELIEVGGTFANEPVPYQVIIDRMSHEIPYYRSYVKYACLHGAYAINNPFIWSSDTKFFSTALVGKLGLKSPRTMVLPNKDILTDSVPDSFRNLKYPMDWEGIIDYIGSPAIFKDVYSGGRRFSHRVSNVDDLILRYDESGTRTMILQQVLETDRQYHCMVVGQEEALLMAYSMDEDCYHKPADLDESVVEQMTTAARNLTVLYGYDINLPEFVFYEDDIYVINATNPVPQIDRTMMTEEEFEWIVGKVATLATSRALEPVEQMLPVIIPDPPGT